MPLPCGHDPAATRPADCRQCWLYDHRPAVRKAWGGDPAGAFAEGPTKTRPRPHKKATGGATCPHLGAPTGQSVACPPCKGKVNLKVFGCGLHGSCLPGSKAAGGVRCCGSCPDHPIRLAKRDHWSNPVTVPDPPEPHFDQDNPVALVTVAAGKLGREMYDISGPLMEDYAERIGADHYVSHWEGHQSWGMSAKFALGSYLERYERVVYVDADVLLRPGCENLLDACGLEEIGAFNDQPHFLMHDPNFPAEFQRFREVMGLGRAPMPFYLNTGVLVIPRSLRHVFTTPTRPMPTIHCGEQHWWNARMHDLGVPVRLLDDRYNFQHWVHRDRFEPPPAAVLHFSGMSDHAERLKQMRRFASGKTAV